MGLQGHVRISATNHLIREGIGSVVCVLAGSVYRLYSYMKEEGVVWLVEGGMYNKRSVLCVISVCKDMYLHYKSFDGRQYTSYQMQVYMLVPYMEGTCRYPAWSDLLT